MEDSYWMAHDGKSVGPLSSSRLTELIAAGKVNEHTQLMRLGEEEWRPASAFFSFRRHRGRRTAGLILAGAAVVAATAGAAFLTLRPAEHDWLIERLPSKVTSFDLSTTWSGDPLAGPLTDASTPAILCGGQDLAASLTGQSPPNTVEELLEQRPMLQCGDAVRRSISSPFAAVHFERQGEEDGVLFVGREGAPFAPPFASHTVGGLDGYCPKSGEDSSCRGAAFVRHEDVWLIGAVEQVTELVRELSREDRTESTNAELARILIQSLESAEQTKAWIKPDTVHLIQPCLGIVTLFGLSSCFPTDVDDSLSRITGLTRAYAWQTTSMKSGRDVLMHRFSFVTRDAEDVPRLASEIEAVRRDWMSHLENHEAQVIRSLREREEADFLESHFHALLRALRESTVTSGDRTVVWLIETELSDSERRDVAQMLAESSQKKAALERVLSSILTGGRPEQGDLAALVGPAHARWMFAPRATTASCGEIRAALGRLVSQGVSPQQFGARFRLEERFSDANCVGHVLPASAVECLTTAPSLSEMEACPVPTTPEDL